MTWRSLGVAVLLVGIGVVPGVLLARATEEGPRTVDRAVPVAASSPSFPTDPPVEVLPDPATPALATDLRSHTETIGQDPFALRVPIPNGWVRSNSKAGEWRWYVADHPTNTYALRISLPSGYSTIPNALASRIDALDGATGIQDFDVESQSVDTFTASYVLDGYRRVTTERFISTDGSTTVYAVIAMIGRDADRDGMTALVDRISSEARR